MTFGEKTLNKLIQEVIKSNGVLTKEQAAQITNLQEEIDKLYNLILKNQENFGTIKIHTEDKK